MPNKYLLIGWMREKTGEKSAILVNDFGDHMPRFWESRAAWGDMHQGWSRIRGKKLAAMLAMRAKHDYSIMRDK